MNLGLVVMALVAKRSQGTRATLPAHPKWEPITYYNPYALDEEN